MNLTEKKANEINEEFLAIRRAKTVTEEQAIGIHKLRIDHGFDTSIYANHWQICRLENLNSMIEELTDMKKAIEEATGIC